MTIGPLEIALIGFKGNDFRGEIAPELLRLHESGTVRIIDLIFVAKDKEGNVLTTEVEQMDDEYAKRYGKMTVDLRGLLTSEDVELLAEGLPNDSAGLAILFEHAWAVAFKEATQRAGGMLIARQQISPEVMEEMAEELEAAIAAGAG